MSKDVEAVLGNIRRVDFDLTPLMPWLKGENKGRKRPGASTIQWVANVTGTVIEEDVAGEKVSISRWLQLH